MIDIDKLDPSMLIGFLVYDIDDWEILKHSLLSHSKDHQLISIVK